MDCGVLNCCSGKALRGHGKPPVRARELATAQTVQQLKLRRNLLVRGVSTESSPAVGGKRARREGNVDGEFYVDQTCIDCDTCRWMAPEVFSQSGDGSIVHKQPTTPEDRVRALQALLSCPTGSIRTVTPPKDIIQVQETFPLPIADNLPGIYHCGFHSEASASAASYLISRPNGNILVDSPRYNERLAMRIEQLGGVKYMFLTHRDDVADHKKWHKRFKCERILHSEEVNAGTADVEIKLEGEGPWSFAPDVEIIFTPGHTQAHVCLLLKDRQVLFTGDHIGASETTGEIFLDHLHNWFDASKQTDSIEALIPKDFIWLLPGHGRRYKFESLEDKNSAFEELVAYERARYNLNQN